MKKFILISTIICVIVATYAGFSLCVKAENLKSIEHNGKYGFVNDKGKIVIDTQFDSVEDFHEGLAAVLLYAKWGFINKKGKFVIFLLILILIGVPTIFLLSKNGNVKNKDKNSTDTVKEEKKEEKKEEEIKITLGEQP